MYLFYRLVLKKKKRATQVQRENLVLLIPNRNDNENPQEARDERNNDTVTVSRVSVILKSQKYKRRK